MQGSIYTTSRVSGGPFNWCIYEEEINDLKGKLLRVGFDLVLICVMEVNGWRVEW